MGERKPFYDTKKIEKFASMNTALQKIVEYIFI